MQFDINKYRSFFIAGDTDSAIFSLEPLLIKKFGKNYKTTIPEEEILLEIRNYLKKYSDKLNNVFLNKFSKDKFNIDNHKFNWKTENIIKLALWTGKRRYAQHIIEKEGVKVDEYDYKGLEMNKSNMNPLFKKFGTQLLKFILSDHTKSEIDNYILEFNKSLKNIEPKLLGKPTGVSFIDKCIKRQAGAGEIFSELNINTKENSRAAIIYNDLLRFKGLDSKYESIIEGDKIFIVNLKSNPYKITVIGFPNSKLPDEINHFIETYIDREAIWNSALQNKLEDLYTDLSWELPNLNPNISKFFSFS